MAIDKIGKFQVLATLGTGAGSSILHIRRAEDSREYALKITSIEEEEDKKYLEQAKHELRVGQMLSHPSIVKVHCLETETDWRFRVKKVKLLVEYVAGKTLDKVPLLRTAKMLRVFEKVAAGLVHMHKQGVIHADLKPSNLMLGKGTNVKIIDFGLAHIKGEPKMRIQGTPEFIAPETVAHKQFSERSDIFNFGATMYRLTTFKLPPSLMGEYEGEEVTEKIYRGRFIAVNELNPVAPKGLVELIHKCMSYNAMQRPERMSEVQGILDHLADEAAAKLDPDELEE